MLLFCIYFHSSGLLFDIGNITIDRLKPSKKKEKEMFNCMYNLSRENKYKIICLLKKKIRFDLGERVNEDREMNEYKKKNAVLWMKKIFRNLCIGVDYMRERHFFIHLVLFSSMDFSSFCFGYFSFGIVKYFL